MNKDVKTAASVILSKHLKDVEIHGYLRDQVLEAMFEYAELRLRDSNHKAQMLLTQPPKKKTSWNKLPKGDDSFIHYGRVCEDHQDTTMTYMKHLDWAELKVKKGHKQKQCDRCGYFFFKCEY